MSHGPGKNDYRRGYRHRVSAVHRKACAAIYGASFDRRTPPLAARAIATPSTKAPRQTQPSSSTAAWSPALESVVHHRQRRRRARRDTRPFAPTTQANNRRVSMCVRGPAHIRQNRDDCRDIAERSHAVPAMRPCCPQLHRNVRSPQSERCFAYRGLGIWPFPTLPRMPASHGLRCRTGDAIRRPRDFSRLPLESAARPA